jgi:hypothetical protein
VARSQAAEFALGHPFDTTRVLAPLVIIARPRRPAPSRDKRQRSPIPTHETHVVTALARVTAARGERVWIRARLTTSLSSAISPTT